MSASTHVSSHCFDAVSREWWRSMSTGRPPSFPSVCATGAVALAAAAAAVSSPISGSSACHSAKSQVAPPSVAPCDVSELVGVCIAHVRTSERASAHIRRSWRRMAHQPRCAATGASTSISAYLG